MLIKLQATQIPAYWEIIKFAAVTVNNVEEKNLERYLIKLLVDLLNGKLQCLVSTNDNRDIYKIMLIGIAFDEILEEKVMIIEMAYGFKKLSLEVWKEEARQVFQYAKNCGCKSLTVTTSNNLITDIALKLGLVEISKNYKINLD